MKIYSYCGPRYSGLGGYNAARGPMGWACICRNQRREMHITLYLAQRCSGPTNILQPAAAPAILQYIDTAVAYCPHELTHAQKERSKSSEPYSSIDSAI